MPSDGQTVPAIVPTSAENQHTAAAFTVEHLDRLIDDGASGVLHQKNSGNMEIIGRLPIDLAKLVASQVKHGVEIDSRHSCMIELCRILRRRHKCSSSPL